MFALLCSEDSPIVNIDLPPGGRRLSELDAAKPYSEGTGKSETLLSRALREGGVGRGDNRNP